ncbi:hypothetical protein BMS3Bbin02_01718 [bacterium BMS3Bbin02]|jgi:hypothetical protein|nr:hypothetical protein BMS3Bbin02_01718 [bacterium BMS3Bbin02]
MESDSKTQNPDPADAPWPVGFLLFVGAVALYLVIRFVDLGIKLVRAIF